MIQELDKVLQRELRATGALETDQVGGVKAVAEILNNVDQASEREIMGHIEESNAPLAEEIRQLMFVFEDLLEVDDRGMQTILREVANDDLKMAMKTASDELMQKILRNLSQRAADMLREELELMGPVRVSDVEKAQQKITQVAKRLENEGKLMLGGKGKIALSNIIRQDHAVVHNIQPFTILKATVDRSTPAPGRVVPGSVITGADADAVPVRLFDFYGLPANADAPRREMEAEADTMGFPTAPETTEPLSAPTALDEVAAKQEEGARGPRCRCNARQGA